MKIKGYSQQDIDQSDIDAVISVLKSDFLTQGPATLFCEEKFCNLTQAKHALTFANATCALHAACYAIGVMPGDTVWTSPNSFVASANCAIYCRANVDFVDINPDTLVIDIELLEDKLKDAKRFNKLPKVLIAVHFGGLSFNIREIRNLLTQYGVRLIEDASHALGAIDNGSVVGSCDFSDICVFSMHPVKMITSGEGGMLLTNSDHISGKAKSFRSHGIIREKPNHDCTEMMPWEYYQTDIGYNYRLTDLASALASSQLERLEKFVFQRNQLAKRYITELSDLPLRFQNIPKGVISSYHLFVAQFMDLEQIKVFKNFKKNNVHTTVHYKPIHTQPFYQRLGFKSGDYPNAENYYKHAISLPLYPRMTNKEQNFVIQLIRDLYK